MKMVATAIGKPVIAVAAALFRPGCYAGRPGSITNENGWPRARLRAYITSDTSRMTVLSGASSLETRVSLGAEREHQLSHRSAVARIGDSQAAQPLAGVVLFSMWWEVAVWNPSLHIVLVWTCTRSF